MFSIRRGFRSSEKRSSLIDDEYYGITKYTSLLKSQPLYRQMKSCNATVLWERKSCGYRIVDLRLDKLAEALRFLPTNFFYEEPMCRAVGLIDDHVSAKSYLASIADQMSALVSFIALAEGSGKIVGVAVASMHSRADDFPYGITQPNGEAFSTLISLKKYALPGAHICDSMNVDSFCYIEVLCVEASHQSRGIGTALIRSCISRASERQIPLIAAHFTSAAAQNIAERLGFQTLAEMPYEMFRELGFKDSLRRSFGFGNYSIALMALLVRQPVYDAPGSPASMSTTTKTSPKTKRSKKKT